MLAKKIAVTSSSAKGVQYKIFTVSIKYLPSLSNGCASTSGFPEGQSGSAGDADTGPPSASACERK